MLEETGDEEGVRSTAGISYSGSYLASYRVCIKHLYPTLLQAALIRFVEFLILSSP